MKLQVAGPGKSLSLRRRTDIVGEVVSAFESETVAVFLRTAPAHQHIILYVLVAMLTLGVTLTAIVKLDIVVTSLGGLIVPTAGSIYISPFDTAIVRRVNVKVGQVVKQGESLATLDPTFTQADLLQLKAHLGSDEAQIAREEAELAKTPYQFSKLDTYQKLQGDIWEQRQREYKAQLSNFDGQIHSTEAQMSQAQSDVEKYTNRLKLAADAENVYQPLLDKGYVSKLQVMQATDSRTEMSRLLADSQNQVPQYRETVASLKAQRDAFIQQWWAATSTQLIADRNDLDTTRDSLDKAQKLQDLTSLDAPEDAVVLQVGMMSSGSVAGGGGPNQTLPPLFTLVPLNAPVEAEIQVATQDIGFIRVRDKVTVKLDAYAFLRYGSVAGVVKTISEGSFTVDANNQPVPPYCKVRIAITALHLRNVQPNFRLIPGMTLTGDILTGRRTILSYIVEGAMKTASQAMREPN